jgi:hypothetical protein
MTLDVEAIVEATDLLGASPKRVVAVLIGYFDDSGTHRGARAAVMAGYIAHRADWKRFELKTKQLFDAEQVPYFRAKMFHHGDDHFYGWSDDRKLAFANKWFGYANRYLMRGITAGAKKEDLATAKASDSRAPPLSNEACCMQMVFYHLCKDQDVMEAIERYGLQVIVERSGKSDGGISFGFDRVVTVNELDHKIKAISFADKKDVRALQLGDYLAYFSQKFAETALDESLAGVTPYLEIAKNNVKTIMKLGQNF